MSQIYDKGIKTIKAIEKYFTTITGVDVMCVKLSDNVRVIWAVNNKLNYAEIECSVIYVIKDEQLDEVTKIIINSISSNNDNT